jgi:radical SAM family protein
VRVLLVSTYDLGRQPFGLASPAAWLRNAGVEVDCADTSREELSDQRIASAGLVAFYLPMHTATRLASPLIDRVRRVNPAARLAAYGLYAPINQSWLRDKGVAHVLGPEGELELTTLTCGASLNGSPKREPQGFAPQADRRPYMIPHRGNLLPLANYAHLQMPDGSTRVVGSTDATRGCKHLCRHCPIVPVYKGRFHAIPADAVLADIRQQIAAGAQHVSFGDPDFLNGPTHAHRIVERLAIEFPRLTYDVTIKIEHILKHASLLPVLARTGCLFITSAVESIDDEVLRHLRKGHTRADFVAAVHLCREIGIALAPTFVAFTPWTTLEGYKQLLQTLEELQLIEQVAPIQLAIRLLITNNSPLLELPDIQAVITEFDPASLTWPWKHPDSSVDALQHQVMRRVGNNPRAPRVETFAAICDLFEGTAHHLPLSPQPAIPILSENWYCCAEPSAEDMRLV